MKKTLAFTLVLVLALALFAGCGGGGGSSAPAVSSEAATSAPEASAASSEAGGDTAAPAGEASGDINFICVYNAEKAKMYEMFDKFNTDNPNMNLNVTAVPTSSEINKQLMILATSSDLPDVVSIDGLYVQSFAAMGILEDITDRIPDLGFDLDLFYPAPLSANEMNGRYYGLPFTTNCIAIYYNKNILAEAGIDEPTESWTWNDFTDIATKTANPSAGVYGAVISCLATSDGTFHFYPWFWGAGGDSYKIDSDAGREAFGMYRTLMDNNAMSPDVINMTQNDCSDQFASGKAALFSGGCWHLTRFEQNITDFEFGIVTHPINPTTGKFATSLGGYSYNLIKGGNVDAAWEFVKFMESEEVMAYFNPAENYIPARKDVAESLDHYTNTDSMMSVYRKAMESAQMRGPHYFWLDIEDVYQNMIQEVVTGAVDTDTALATAQEKVDAILARG